jgi:flagellar motor switch protein FliN/FliY
VGDDNASELPVWLAEELARQLTHVMESMLGEASYVTYVPHELLPQETEAGEAALLWWEQHFSLGPGTVLWIGAKRQSWEQIGNRVLRSAGVEDGDPDSIRSTYLEIVNQALSGVASALSTRAREQVACKDGREARPPASGEGSCYSFEIGVGDATFPIYGLFGKVLSGVPEAPQADTAKRPEPAPATVTLAPSGKASAIDLLLDVELPVSVSFGRAQLPLKDVIKLTTGSIVELNRAVSEPVDVIVNNCVIARGEVVVVEGNFGVRIRQVISRQERLRTLY